MRRITINILSLAIALFFTSSVFAQIVPTAGMTETIAVADGDLFYDPSDGTNGGPGGDCSQTSSGDPGDYPNCGCVTTTTLTAQDLEVTFTEFSVFANFDWLKVYDGTSTAGTLLMDGQANDVDDLTELMDNNGGSATFVSTTGALTFEFNATAVVNTCGWEAEVSAFSAPASDDCFLACPPDVTVTVDYDLCSGIVNLAAPVPTGDCGGATLVLDPDAEDYTAWSTSTSTSVSTTPGGCGAGSGAAFAICTDGYPQGTTFPMNANFDDNQMVIDDDEAGIPAVGTFCWESPVLDLSAGGIMATWDYEFRSLGSSFLYAEATGDGGSTWDNLWTGPTSSDEGNVTASLNTYSNSDFQLRLCMDDGGSWAWGGAFDNVAVYAAAAAQAPTNDFDGGTDLVNAEFPLGTTTVTWTTFDASGNVVECSTDVTVVDPGPQLDCPGDFTVTLDPGDCQYYYNYVVGAESCVGLVADTICNTVYQWDNLDIDPALSLSCSATPVNYWRVYDQSDLGVSGNPDDIFAAVTVWFRNSGTQNVQVRVHDYTGGPVGDALDLSFATEIASGSMTVSGIVSDSVNIPVSFFDYSAYQTLLVEVQIGAAFTMAQTLSTTTEPSWLSSAPCGITTMPLRPGSPGLLAGFPDNYAFLAPTFCYQSFESARIQGTASGEPLPIGTTVFEYEFEDLNGNTASCSWTATVVEYPDPITDFACNNVINVSPDEDCEILITADMLLEGGPYGCYDNYDVSLYTDMSQTVPVPNPVTGAYTGTTIVGVVTGPNGVGTCWGYINVEDKLIPDLLCDSYEVDCDDDTSPGIVPAGSVSVPTDGTPGTEVTNTADNVTEIPISLQGTFSSVTDVNVSLDISHTWIGDMTATLTSPSGTVVTLFDNIGGPGFGCANDDIVVSLDDQAAAPYADLDAMCNATPPAAMGTFQPQDALSTFNGEEANGTWLLTISDNFGGDNGTLNSYNVTINADIVNGIPLPLPSTATATPNGDGYTVTGFDPCSDVYLAYEDEEINIDCTLGSGYTGLILRHWTATDAAGNEATCTDSILLRAATLGTLTLPVDRDGVDAPALECNGAWDYGCDGIANTGDAGEGDGIPQPCELGDEISSLCDIWANYTDTEFPVCGYNTKKIFREWYILDKCTGEFINHTQVIVILDTEAPVINCPDQMTVGSDPYNCGGTWQVPAPDAYDNCSGIASWTVTAAAGTVVNFGGIYTIQGLPEGCTEITYTVYDGCGNDATCVTEVCVIDDVPPVPVCDFNTIVSLGVDGRAKIYAETFDDGSYDNCCLDRVEVRRTQFNSCWNTFYGPHVEFCCDDIGTVVEVELRAVDCSGNTNTCWVNVTVEDKLNPVVVCPPDITVSCDYKFDLNDLGTTFGKVVIPANGEVRGDIYIDDKDYQEDCQGSIYAGPVLVGQDGYAADNCDVTVSEIANANLSCGTGVITRIFTATDAGGRTSSCIQRITIVDCDPFYIADTDSPCRDRGGVYTTTDDVTWPCDVTLDGCNGAGTDPDMTGRPIYEDDKCSLVADTFVDEVFTIVDDACFKILRHWSIIDWCQEDPSTGLPYRWDYTQVIKVIDEEGPIVTPADPGCDLNATECAGYTNLAPIVEDCTPADHIVYWWRIDAYNDGVGTLPGGYDFEGTTADPSGVYPYGTHRILWVIEDMCGNRTTAEYTFEVADCKKPSPVCINGLSSVVMPSSGQIEIWSIDFDASSFDNCDDDLDFRIWYDYMDSTSYPDQSIDWTLPTASSTGDDVLDYLPTGAIFYCDAMGNGQSRTFTVRIYVVDDAGNWDYCTTNITIDDNDDVCPDGMSITISGTHNTEYGEWIDGVTTTAINDAQQIRVDEDSDDNGEFAFLVSADGYDWEITAEKNDHYLNGVNAQDLSLIQRHVAGIEYLNSNYKLVAADANSDTEINIIDVLELRKLLLGINSELSNTTSWKHIDADYTFPGVTNTNLPADVYTHEMISFDNLTTNENETDYIGVKIGDVDGDAVANSFVAGEERSGNTTVFTTVDATFAAGDEVKVTVNAENFADITAYQFTIGFDQSVLAYVGAEAGALEVSDANFGTQFADRGMVTTVWYDATAQSRASEEGLFTLTFKATAAGQLHNVISLGSAITPAMAFSNETGRNNVSLQFLTQNGEIVDDAFALYQNAPNPFIDATTISYVLPEDADVTLTVYDMSGRVLKTATQEGTKGINTFELNRSELSAAGVLYYQVETDNYTATKRMVVAK